VRERGKGEGRRKIKIRRKNRGPSTLLKYVPPGYFLLPLAKLLPLTNGSQKKTKDTTYFLLYFLLLLRLTDWAQVRLALALPPSPLPHVEIFSRHKSPPSLFRWRR
jgi:hypothetical protein